MTFTFLAFREFADVLAPHAETLVALAFIRRDAERCADMVEHDGRVGECAREVDEVRQLRLQQPSVERQSELVQNPEALAEFCVTIEPLRHAAVKRTELRPDRRPTTNSDGCRESGHVPPAICERRTSSTTSGSWRKSVWPTMPAQARTLPYNPLAVMAATPFTNSVSPTHLSASGPSARYIAPPFHIDRADHVVAGFEIRQQLVQQIARDVADDVHEPVIGGRQVSQNLRRPVHR
ncbi:MAG: hypothetical protein WDM89_01635 [Rhizomicrobium sp.]